MYDNSSEALEQVAQRRGGCCILGDIKDQGGGNCEQLDLAVDVPVHCRREGPDDF